MVICIKAGSEFGAGEMRLEFVVDDLKQVEAGAATGAPDVRWDAEEAALGFFVVVVVDSREEQVDLLGPKVK